MLTLIISYILYTDVRGIVIKINYTNLCCYLTPICHSSIKNTFRKATSKYDYCRQAQL